MDQIIHPCRDKSIRIAVSTVMDDLVTDSVIIENLNLIVKLDNQRVQIAFSRVSRGSDPSRASSADDDSGGLK